MPELSDLIESANDGDLEDRVFEYVVMLQKTDPGAVHSLPLSLQAHFSPTLSTGR